MDWTNIITTLIVSGGFTAIFTIVEKKSKLVIENARQLAEGYKALADEYQEREAQTQKLLERKEEELLNQIKMNSSLRHDLDDSHTLQAVAEMRRCDVLKCPNRQPPFGANADLIMDAVHGRRPKKETICESE